MAQAQVFEPGMPVRVEIDGKDYPLRFTLKALKELQRDHNISVIRGGVDAFTDPEKLALILFYGLRGLNPDITLEWVEEHVDAGMLVSMMPALGFAMSGRAPETSPNPQAPAKANGIGSPFGPSGATISDTPSGNSGG